MKTKLKMYDIATSVLCLCGILPGLCVYSKLPEQIPIHFNLHNQADNFAPKAVVIFVMPIVFALIQLIICSASGKYEGEKVPENAKILVRLIIPVMNLIVETATVLYALDRFTNISSVITCFIGIMLLILGNYLPKTRRNGVFGIKVPPTLESDEVWEKTHRLAGKLMVLAGIAVVILVIMQLEVFAFCLLPAAVIIPIIYAYMCEK